MGNLSVRNLIELLKSQVLLLGELHDILNKERDAVLSWHVQDTLEFNKQKEAIIRKQRILDEARKSLISKIKEELVLEEETISGVINAVSDDDLRSTLTYLKDTLVSETKSIEEITVGLKSLYSTNLKLIKGVYERFGYSSSESYSNGSTAKAKTLAGSPSIQALG